MAFSIGQNFYLGLSSAKWKRVNMKWKEKKLKFQKLLWIQINRYKSAVLQTPMATQLVNKRRLLIGVPGPPHFVLCHQCCRHHRISENPAPIRVGFSSCFSFSRRGKKNEEGCRHSFTWRKTSQGPSTVTEHIRELKTEKDGGGWGEKEFMRVIQVPAKEQPSIKWTTSVKHISVMLGHFYTVFFLAEAIRSFWLQWWW